MTTQITDEQRRAIEQQHGGPVYVVDPANKKSYVLVAEEIYQRVQAIVESELVDVRDIYAAQERAFAAAGWDDPRMDAYNDYDAQRQKL